MFQQVETPRLILDRAVLQRNADRFLARAAAADVVLRPHLKTAKSIAVAKVATGGRMSTVTVSTLKEAERFAAAGFDDILYAVGISPNKLSRVQRISDETGKRILVVTDNRPMAEAMAAFSRDTGFRLQVLLEIDSGEGRGGLPPRSPELVEIGRSLAEAPGLDFRGVITHAGHSYAVADPAAIADIAEAERRSATDAAVALRDAGIACEIVSVGSTPTFLHARSFEGVTEARCGVYAFFDLAQLSRNVCAVEDIALTVLASVIGHNRKAGTILIDAGALALSKDVSANTFMSDAHYGHVCDPLTMQRLGELSVAVVHQEHGSIPVEDRIWFERLPIGSLVRILPNHACMTAAAGYESYLVVDGDRITAEWDRFNGW